MSPIDVSTNQHQPSLWMLVAIAQSLFWFFGLPIICRKFWDDIFGSMPPMAADFCLSVFVPILINIICNIVMLPVYYIQHPFFEQYKVQSDRPWGWLEKDETKRQAFWALSARSVKLTVFNMGVLLPMLAVGKFYTLQFLGLAKPNLFKTDDEHWPTARQSLENLILLALVHEFGFYVTHRLAHTYPFLYKYHKVHHEYKTNTTLAALHNHPVDFVLSIGGPALLTVLIVNPHSMIAFQFAIWTMVANADDHVGYSFPWSPVRWFPFAASTDEHEFHHSKNLGCFASKLSIYNSLLGGYEQYDQYTIKKKAV